MYRTGNYPAQDIDVLIVQTPTLSTNSSVIRYTLGMSWLIERSLRLKLSGELWQFSDKNDDGKSREVGLHAGLVGTF
jgi:hypothetical protein